MTDREKVIRGLEWCIKLDGNGCSLECPYFAGKKPCPNVMLRDALALLKEQEARVMTLEEVETSQGFVWVEFQSTNENRLSLEYVNVRATERFRDSFILCTDSGIKWLRNRSDYNRGIWFGINSGWRCWTARPSPDQMRDTKWEDSDEKPV